MSVQIKLQTETFRIVPNGSAGSVTLSLAEAPFPANGPGKIVGVAYVENQPYVTGISLSAKTVTISYDLPPFDDPILGSLFVTYDPL